MERVANSSSRSLTGAARIAAKSFECAKHAGFEEVWNLADTGEKRLRGLSASSEKNGVDKEEEAMPRRRGKKTREGWRKRNRGRSGRKIRVQKIIERKSTIEKR